MAQMIAGNAPARPAEGEGDAQSIRRGGSVGRTASCVRSSSTPPCPLGSCALTSAARERQRIEVGDMRRPEDNAMTTILYIMESCVSVLADLPTGMDDIWVVQMVEQFSGAVAAVQLPGTCRAFLVKRGGHVKPLRPQVAGGVGALLLFPFLPANQNETMDAATGRIGRNKSIPFSWVSASPSTTR